MKTWTTTTFTLTPADHPTVCIHANSVSLHVPGYMSDGRGFSLDFAPAHLPIIQHLCAALATFPPPRVHTDHNSFVTDPACPGCTQEAQEDSTEER